MDEYIGVTEVARILGVSRQTVYNYIHGGALRPHQTKVTLKNQTRYLFRRDYIERIAEILTGAKTRE